MNYRLISISKSAKMHVRYVQTLRGQNNRYYVTDTRSTGTEEVLDDQKGTEMIEYECPVCGEAVTSPSSLAGKEDFCSRCGEAAVVPESTGKISCSMSDEHLTIAAGHPSGGSDSIRFACQCCGQILIASSMNSGKQAICVGCNRTLVIPKPVTNSITAPAEGSPKGGDAILPDQTSVDEDDGVSQYPIKCGLPKPPGQKSAGIRGKGILEIKEGILNLHVTQERKGLVVFLTAVVTSVIRGFAVALGPNFSIPIILPGFLIWYIIFSIALKKRLMFTIDHKAEAYYMQKKQITCLQLPDETWVAIKAKKANTASDLYEDLQFAYGARMTVGR